VKGIAQDDLRTHVFQAARHHALDGAVSADRHEDWRLHHAVVQHHRAATGVAAGVAGLRHRRVGAQHIELNHGLGWMRVRMVVGVIVVVCHGDEEELGRYCL
jgi:hypothetical protein